MNSYKIFFFGDSICFGQGVSLYKGWVPRIAAQLDKDAKVNHCEILVSNSSVNGSTTRQALERMPYEIQNHAPDILIIQFGMNDCNFWETDKGVPRVSPRAFEANLVEMIDRAFVFKTKYVLLNTNHPTLRSRSNMNYSNMTYQQSNEAYNQIIRRVAEQCQKQSLVLNDIEREIRKFVSGGVLLEDLVLPDLLHLSEKGHDLYFSITYPLIRDLLFKLNQTQT